MHPLETMLAGYSGDVAAARYSYYLRKTIGSLGSTDETILKGLNRSPMSWQVMLHSLQTNMHVALGRVFDGDPRSVSACRLLDECVSGLHEFSADRLLERKIADGLDSKMAAEYVRDAQTVTAADFEPARMEAARWRDVYVQKYQPVRHKLIAHTDIDHLDKVDLLVAATSVDELEEMLDSIRSIERFIWELLHNGRVSSLSQFTHKDEPWLVADATALIRSVGGEA